ncbi:triphosphoribosyl-dephospho-CoA synthase CitG [Buttiauxella ferragutiae]|uniref:triphosphoribosyl-dephospho-CoA synthase CitG n=1 Tax=Buttiauxella ferragutiae TaxID=82989 RepID=UPI001F52F73E|nr:triphosphoribosyl-dephospho-CoA synthase CitG [Buttiauxella ferragutiae]UNK59919.1 triphosphoribosyl-dephospho-CoA synthase CitG [Buttiauxella ferragutiae]
MAGLPGIEAPEVTVLPQVDICRLAQQALWDEVWLTPKPGLVDSANNGSHRDMDLALFLKSITAIAPWFSAFRTLGIEHSGRPAKELLNLIRPTGIACEQAMYQATWGVNTHKGGVFSLGLLCTAAGRLEGKKAAITASSLCETVSEICAGLVERELINSCKSATVGERLYQQFGLTGARGEAESGFMTVREHVLPYWFEESNLPRRLLNALLRLMAHNPDTNLVSRGGLAGLQYVQRYAMRLLHQGWTIEDIREMDANLIARNLSPGGSADLLAVSYILANVST